jgi:hypothetical protein
MTHAVALRVALGETDDEEVEMERIFGQHAFERGFGLEPLFSGALQTPTRGLRSASCWPWGVCLHTLRVDGEVETDCPHGPYGPYGPYGTAGAEIARALRRASETVLALDACAVRNHVRARGEWCLIDFDPYFTKVAETAEQRAAARGFVAVQMLLLGSQMPGLFTLEDIAEETERGEEEWSEEERSEEGEEGEEGEAKRSEEGEEGEEERSEAVEAVEAVEAAEAKRSEEAEEERNYDEGPQAKRHRKSTYGPSVPTEDEGSMSTEDREDREVSREELARELVARIVRVAASFPDAARALACVVQMYGAYGMVGVARKPARRAMADANKPDSVEALVGAGLCETHASLFVRAALGLVGPDEFEEVYAARIAGFFRPSGPGGPSGPSGSGGTTESTGPSL